MVHQFYYLNVKVKQNDGTYTVVRMSNTDIAYQDIR